jgi:hypothetical protein
MELDAKGRESALIALEIRGWIIKMKGHHGLQQHQRIIEDHKSLISALEEVLREKEDTCL